MLFTSLVSFMPIASFMAFDEIVPRTCSLLEGIARQRKTWATQKSKTKMHGSYIDFGGIHDPFRVRCHPKSETLILHKFVDGFGDQLRSKISKKEHQKHIIKSMQTKY